MANLALLGYFKYYSFAGDTLAALFGRQVLPVRDIALPLGISFYTFQAMSYVIDLYRGKTQLQKSWFLMALYISFFPQLVAGPIVRYTEIEAQLQNRCVTVQDFSYGVKRFLYGMAKKVILANCFAAVPMKFLGWLLPLSAHRWPGSARCIIHCRFIMIFRAIPIWQSASAQCLALPSRKTSIIPIFPAVSANSGGVGI